MNRAPLSVHVCHDNQIHVYPSFLCFVCYDTGYSGDDLMVSYQNIVELLTLAPNCVNMTPIEQSPEEIS